MGRMPSGTYLWPGVTRLWRQGSWSGLGVAVGFAVLVDLAMAMSLVWPELASPATRHLVWAAVVLFWVVSVVSAIRWDRRQAAWPTSGSVRNAFAAALDHYLKGNWFEAERILDGLLAENPRDADAGLMRATLFRHTGRCHEAVAELERIERFECTSKWELEIRRERELLERATSRSAEPSGEASASASPQAVSEAA